MLDARFDVRRGIVGVGDRVVPCCGRHQLHQPHRALGRSSPEVVRRLHETLGAIDKLAKHKGHLYNWYDTETLQPLLPRYVSTVDSGNLAGHCVAVANALETWNSSLQFDPERLNGLNDFSLIVQEHVQQAGSANETLTAAARDGSGSA